MYLQEVLKGIREESAPPGRLNAEHLYKMNEAIFNLHEEDNIDARMAKTLFDTLEKIRKAYNTGKISDRNNYFFYDYVALLGTMQNQHFFSTKQTEKMLEWVKEAIDDGSMKPAPPSGKASKADDAKLKKLEADNKRLKDQMAKLTEVSAAVTTIKTFNPAAEPKAKAKAKSKAEPKKEGKKEKKGDEGDAKPKAKGKKEKKEPKYVPKAKDDGEKKEE